MIVIGVRIMRSNKAARKSSQLGSVRMSWKLFHPLDSFIKQAQAAFLPS